MGYFQNYMFPIRVCLHLYSTLEEARKLLNEFPCFLLPTNLINTYDKNVVYWFMIRILDPNAVML